jgi:LysM repeat protein
MSRTRVRRRRTVTVLAVLACLLVTGPVSRAFAPQREPREPRRVYVVRTGDTVWSIATRFAAGADPRPLVDAIGLRNHVDPGAIVPGQALVIPPVG